jgi:hypothetical protein
VKFKAFYRPELVRILTLKRAGGKRPTNTFLKMSPVIGVKKVFFTVLTLEFKLVQVRENHRVELI